MSLTLQFIPYSEIESLDSKQRIKKLLDIAKQNKIVLLEGRLTPEEEGALIQKTMESISKKFKGIELAVLYPESASGLALKRFKARIVNMLQGNRAGLTIIGPASVVKEIKQDPDKIQLLTQ
jgi:hypothetical protein